DDDPSREVVANGVAMDEDNELVWMVEPTNSTRSSAKALPWASVRECPLTSNKVRSMVRVWLSLVVLASGVLVAPAAVAGKDPNLVRAETFVNKRCPAPEREILSQMWIPGFGFNALFGNCRAGDGRDQHIWFFKNGRFVGTDAPNSSHDILGLWRDDR